MDDQDELRRLIRQAVFDHRPDGQTDPHLAVWARCDPMGIATERRRQIGLVSIEVRVTAATAMLRTGDLQFARTAGVQTPAPTAGAVSPTSCSRRV
jgi:hypothetical protein